MKANANPSPAEASETGTAPDNNIVQLRASKRQRQADVSRHRFKVSEFINAGGSKAWRVAGYKRDGGRVRENFADLPAAQVRQTQLEAEFFARAPQDNALRATRLNDTQLRIAEAAFIRLDDDAEMLTAVTYWLDHGRQHAVAESPRLDDAFTKFCEWLTKSELRKLSRQNLRIRVNMFCNGVPNMRVADVTPDTIESYLSKRTGTAKTKDNDRRAISRFFSWCIERPRKWATMNPCREIKIAKGDEAPPAVLSLKECRALLKRAETFEKGRLAPYVAVCLFGGLRPYEASRLTWGAVNLTDGEIRLEQSQTKTGKPRVVAICETLAAWLKAHKGKAFFPSNWRKDFDAVKAKAGFGGRVEGEKKRKPWPVDVMRHTAISHYFRKTGSYGQTAEQFGNSEAIIKAHYQSRVNTKDTEKFYALLPKKGGRK